APLFGVPEDPATGSANVTLIGLLAHLDKRADLTLSRTIGQGFDMGRPSLLLTRVRKQDGKIVSAHVGGSCVQMMEGTFRLAGEG
ncbi:MAG TPA: PhzF family phenazine biosynthesis protein, partial [Candidatus Acidoferrales bacterium]|nr:PhzF family phenazine biosynthesis protein [Candidatus Acidoferrales bacterium]